MIAFLIFQFKLNSTVHYVNQERTMKRKRHDTGWTKANLQIIRFCTIEDDFITINLIKNAIQDPPLPDLFCGGFMINMLPIKIMISIPFRNNQKGNYTKSVFMKSFDGNYCF